MPEARHSEKQGTLLSTHIRALGLVYRLFRTRVTGLVWCAKSKCMRVTRVQNTLKTLDNQRGTFGVCGVGGLNPGNQAVVPEFLNAAFRWREDGNLLPPLRVHESIG